MSVNKTRTIAPTTSLGEASRLSDVSEQAKSQSHDEVSWIEGKIKSVNETRRVVQVADKARGVTLFGGQWIPLAHSVHEIIDRFGQVRIGMEVLVLYSGKSGAAVNAYAWIIGEEDESGPNKDLAENDIPQGFNTVLMENV